MNKRELEANGGYIGEGSNRFRRGKEMVRVRYGEDGYFWNWQHDGGMFIAEQQMGDGMTYAFYCSEMAEWDRVNGNDRESEEEQFFLDYEF